MSAFFRESAVKAMREAHPDTARRDRSGIIGDAGPNWPGRVVTSAPCGPLSEGNRSQALSVVRPRQQDGKRFVVRSTHSQRR
jgi:hypothetical protein